MAKKYIKAHKYKIAKQGMAENAKKIMAQQKNMCSRNYRHNELLTFFCCAFLGCTGPSATVSVITLWVPSLGCHNDERGQRQTATAVAVAHQHHTHFQKQTPNHLNMSNNQQNSPTIISTLPIKYCESYLVCFILLFLVVDLT